MELIMHRSQQSDHIHASENFRAHVFSTRSLACLWNYSIDLQLTLLIRKIYAEVRVAHDFFLDEACLYWQGSKAFHMIQRLFECETPFIEQRSNLDLCVFGTFWNLLIMSSYWQTSNHLTVLWSSNFILKRSMIEPITALWERWRRKTGRK